ncbi:MAG: CDP-glucose 4,6-dehydratase, partial [Clostridium butyricum]|nr:CDP-glucose 4,6-dehydratase [Clostridium butyricum]
MFNKIYFNKKILITGHTGFKGTWLTLWLKELGAEILGYSLEPHTTPNMFNLCNAKENIRHIIEDI